LDARGGGQRCQDLAVGRQVLARLLVRGDALLGDAERREPVQHRARRGLVGRTVVQSGQDVAV
jgi:hypothetical protein